MTDNMPKLPRTDTRFELEMEVNPMDRFELIMTPEAWSQVEDVQEHLDRIRQRAGQKRYASKSEAIRWCLVMWSHYLNNVLNPEDLRDDDLS